MNAPRLTRHVLAIALAAMFAGCRGTQDDAANGGGEPNTDENLLQNEISRATKVTDPPGSVRANLNEVTLRLGDKILKPAGPATVWRRTYDAGSRKILVSKTRVTAIRTADGKALWSNESADGHHLHWMTFKGNSGFFLGYQVNENERFGEYDKPPRIRRINLENGKWLKDLQIDPGDETTVKAFLSAKASREDLAILSSLMSADKAGDDAAPVVAYQVTCFRGDDPSPLWSKTFQAEGERGYGGVYVWGITPPKYSHSDNQHLNWLGETLLVAAEDMQPILALNRDTGTRIWEVERIWEYDRGFIGPSVYRHYISRFGIEDLFDKNKESIDAARKAFNQQFTCAVIGGPVVVPLAARRGGDSHSIFVAVSKASVRQWSGYLADCVVYELSERGTPISMVKVPQLISGGRFKILKDGLVWTGHNDSILKLVPSRGQPMVIMGGGGTDLITRLAWFRQTNWQPPQAWLTAGRAAHPVAFSRSHAFYLPGGGYITNEGDHDYSFPIAALALSSCVEQELVLNVPFEGTISAPSTNYRSSASGVSTATFYVMAITDLRVNNNALDVTIGMDKWSATLSFSLDGIAPDADSSVGLEKPTKDYSAIIERLGSTTMLSEELRSVAGRWVKHGGGRQRVELNEGATLAKRPPQELIALDEALARFAALEPAKAELL